MTKPTKCEDLLTAANAQIAVLNTGLVDANAANVALSTENAALKDQIVILSSTPKEIAVLLKETNDMLIKVRECTVLNNPELSPEIDTVILKGNALYDVLPPSYK